MTATACHGGQAVTALESRRRRREVERELRLLRQDIDNRLGELLAELMQIEALDRDELAARDRVR